MQEDKKFLVKYYLLYFLKGFFFLKQYLVILLDNTLTHIEVSFVLSAGIITSIISSIPISFLSSKFGNKNVFECAMCAFLASYIILLFNHSIYAYIFFSISSAIFDISFNSSNESLAYGNMKQYNLTKSFAEYKSKSKFCKFFGMTVAAFLAGDLVYDNVKIVFCIDILILTLALSILTSVKDIKNPTTLKKDFKRPLKYLWKHKTLMKCIIHRNIWLSLLLFLNVYKSLYFEELAINDYNINIMISFQMFLVTVLQVFLVKRLSKKSIFVHYGLFIVASLFMLASFYYYHGLTSYFLMIMYYVLSEAVGDLTYSYTLSFIPHSEMTAMLSLMNLGNNFGKLIFINIFGAVSSIASHRAGFLTLGLLETFLCLLIYTLIIIDVHMKNINRRTRQALA